MAEYNTRIQQKADTQSNFESANPVLLENELVIVFMTDGSIKFKVGDGTSSFNDLEYTDKYLEEVINTLSQNIQDFTTLLLQIQNSKANTESPSFTGTPTAPTANSGTSTTQIATTEFVMDAISSGGGGGTEIIVSSEQPAGQSVGSFWYKIIS